MSILGVLDVEKVEESAVHILIHDQFVHYTPKRDREDLTKRDRIYCGKQGEAQTRAKMRTQHCLAVNR